MFDCIAGNAYHSSVGPFRPRCNAYTEGDGRWNAKSIST